MAQSYEIRLNRSQLVPDRGLQRRHQKFKLATFPTKLLDNVNNPILKYLCKFQINIQPHARVTAVQSLEDLYTFILWQPSWWSQAHPQPFSPYKIMEKCQTSLAHNSVFIDTNNFKFGTETRSMVL